MNFLSKLLTGDEPLQPDSPLPDLVVETDDGVEIALNELLGRDLVLLYFYPKANTLACTAQACHLRDSEDALTTLGVRVVGVSIDSVESQKRFRKKQRLPFSLIADSNGKLSKAFGVACGSFFAMRTSFLIRDGKVLAVIENASITQHAAQVRKALAACAERSSGSG